MNQKLLAASVTGFLCMVALFADQDYDLRINGDFRGAASNAVIAPGWTASTGAVTRIQQSNDFDEFCLEIRADSQKAASVYSDLLPIRGNLLKVEADIRGSGIASVGFLAFDAAKKPLQGNTRSYKAAAYWGKVKNYFTISDPNTRFVKIVLTAEKGSVITFGDVEAELKVQYGHHSASTPSANSVPTSAVSVVESVVAAAPAVTQMVPAQPLIYDKLYSLKQISRTVCQATVPLRGEVEFELEEDVDKGHYWTISSYDSSICRVEIKHDRDGIWPFRYDKAEIDLKGIAPGTTTVVFTYPDGKSFSVIFTVR